MPIRGHSGVQGGAEMGAYATAFPGGVAIDADSAARLAARYGFPVGDRPGLDRRGDGRSPAVGARSTSCTRAAATSSTSCPDPVGVEGALAHVPVRVHQDIVVTSQMLVDRCRRRSCSCPACTRYEQRGGGTETTTERRIAFSPEVRGPRVGEARAEWEIFGDLAARVRPELADAVRFPDADAIRAEIADVVPAYAGIEHLSGSATRCSGAVHGSAPAAGSRPRTARRTSPSVRPAAAGGTPGPGAFVLSTRRGKQFNSMVYAAKDPLTGAGATPCC